MLAFLILSFTYLFAFNKLESRLIKKDSILTILICIVIGGGIEILQHYLPIKRHGDYLDFIFDIVGILLGVVIFIFMKKKSVSFLLICLLYSGSLRAQNQSSSDFQNQLNEEFKNPEESPLDEEDRLVFKALEFFEIDDSFIVEAQLVKQNSPLFFGMETTTDRRPEYRIWAYAQFELNGKEFKLTIYQNKKLMNSLEYGDYLFLPYTDLSNDSNSYYGGRYIDLRIVDGNSITIDFNKSYNPYCAYSERFSCPKVPKENHLDVFINAGVKRFH